MLPLKTLRRANEEYFKNLPIPTRSDITRVAEMVVTLEEKVDYIEDAVEEDKYVNMATRVRMHQHKVKQAVEEKHNCRAC